jgi:hypothetical protein
MLLCAGSSPNGKRRKKNIDIIASFELACMQRMRARMPSPPTHTVSLISAGIDVLSEIQGWSLKFSVF